LTILSRWVSVFQGDCSHFLEEADLVGLLTEASSAEHDLVLSDETFLVSANAAGARVLAVLSRVGVLLVGHLLTTMTVLILDL